MPGWICASWANEGGRKMSVERNRLAVYLDLIRWNRPAGWLLLLWPTLGALWAVSYTHLDVYKRQV